MSARVKFFALHLLAALALLVAVFFFLKTNRSAVMANNRDQLDDYLSLAENLVDGWRQSQLRSARELAGLPAVRAWAARRLQGPPGAADPLADELSDSLGERGYALFDAALQLHASAAPAYRPDVPLPPGAREALEQAQRLGAAISPPFPAPPAGAPVQLLCARLAPTVEPGPVLCLYFDLNADLLQTLSSARRGEVFAVDRRGQLLTDRPELALGAAAQRPMPSLEQAMAAGPHYQEDYRNRDGVAVAGLLRWHDDLQLGLVAEKRMDELYAPYAQARNMIVSFTGLALFLLLGLGLLSRHSRQHLSRREAFYHQVLDHLPLQVRIRDLQGRQLLQNRLTRERQVVLPDLPLECAAAGGSLPTLSREAWQVLREVLHSGQVCQRQLLQGRVGSAEFKAYRVLGFPIWSRPGHLLALGSVALDETTQVRDSQALQALTEDLESQIEQRTAELAKAKDAAEAGARARTDFLANMSHEIRSPLNAVIGLAHLAQRGNSDPRIESYLQRILKSGQHLQEVVNNILDFSKIDAGKLQIERLAFSPRRLLESVSDMLWDKARSKQLEMVFDLDPRLPDELYGDPLRIAQILLNFADNAIKFTAEGLIGVRVHMEERRGEQWMLSFEVQDSGIGIPAESLAEIFQPFEQLDSSTTRRFGGTGLGLAICAQLARLMGGQLVARSEPGVGSLFALALTLEGVAPSHAAANEGGSRRALLVDADPESQGRLSEMLAALGLQTEVAASARRAGELLRQAHAHPHPYALVLLDWRLPELSPSEFTAWASREQLLLRSQVILLGPHGGQTALPDSVLEDFAAVLDKPVSPQRLRETVLRLEQSEEVRSLQGRHVLLVENEKINQEVARELLETLGVKVSLADNGAEALVCLAQDASIELVLMDVQMPVMDGLKAARVLRPIYPQLPIIAMTANSFSGDRERCLAAGMNDYLAKPIDPQRLGEKLVRWLRLPAPPAAPSAVEGSAGVGTRGGDGLNREAALERLLGNEALYQRLLQRFGADYAETATQLEQLLQAGEQDKAIELVHRFKSVAATIGAERLASLAHALEQQWREGQPGTDGLTGFTGELRRLLEQLAPCG